MITVIARLTAAEGQADTLRANCQKMIAAVKANEPEVVAYSLHESTAEPGVFVFFEQYPNEDVKAAHGKTPHMAEFGGGLKGVVAGRPVIETFTAL